MEELEVSSHGIKKEIKNQQYRNYRKAKFNLRVNFKTY